MADYALTGKELKRHIKLARDAPLPFAYNPAAAKGDDYFALHRKRSAEQLGKAAKADGPGAKAAYGQAKVEGRVLELRCEVAVPGMARKLKKHLKASKVTLNIMVIGPDGSVLEEDIEELADDPDLFDDSPEAGDEDKATFAEQDDQEKDDEEQLETAKKEDAPPPPAGNAADLVAGLKRLQPAIAAAPGPVADKLKAVVTQIAGQIKAGQLEAAQGTFEKLEAAVAKLPRAAPEAAAPPPPPPPPPEPEPQAAPSDGDADRLRALAERAKRVQAQIADAQVPDEVREKLMAAFQNAVGALKAKDLETASTLLDKIEEALTRLGMASDSIRDGGKDKKGKKADKDKEAHDADGKHDAPQTHDADGKHDAPQTHDADGKHDAPEHAGKDNDETVTANGPAAPGTPEAAKAPQDHGEHETADADGLHDADGGHDGDDFDEKAHDLADKIETLRTRMIAQFGLEVQTALGERLDRAVTDLEAGTYSSALPAMAFVEESMRLQDAIDALAPDFARAASTGSVEDVDRMRLLFNSAVELVAGPDHAKAWGMLQKVQDMIQDGARRNVNAFLADIPEDARPFAISRLNWTSARTAMKGELDKLRDGIARAVDGQPEYQGIMDNIGSLYAHMDGLDLRLATKLDEVVNADPGAERDTRKAEARNLVREYQSELDKPFFQEVDAANGFAAVAVTATARDALGEIDKVLAA